ncbi:SH3 domain-containing protein [Halobacteriovorax sp. GB3]|uniref:SH3 domain-containing protein n=1 Tax=Halobacteriovorax sp. GB3 TaxID=2719615 RepID=UPI00235E216E|nr:SH3 domain-containing protein [Halobacteriovorax sp. GB3]MDD0852797.1 SH3 domain-containing protein [Halobacteriovorax sp. GB3]
MDQIEQTPLGGKNLGDILKKNTIERPSIGLSKLLKQNLAASETEVLQDKGSLASEYDQLEADMEESQNLLKSEREENQRLSALVESINDKLDRLEKLEDFEKRAMQQISETIKENMIEVTPMTAPVERIIETSTHKDGLNLDIKKILSLVGLSLIVGAFMGNFLFPKTPEVIVKEIVKKIPAKVPPKVIETRFVTLKFANLRDQASPKGELIQTLSPNQSVKFIEQKGGWHKVEYHDLISDKKVTGWLWYELIKKLK